MHVAMYLGTYLRDLPTIPIQEAGPWLKACCTRNMTHIQYHTTTLFSAKGDIGSKDLASEAVALPRTPILQGQGSGGRWY